ncbi:MAG: hypothetical protein H0U07_08450 [Actinobacteria bacterium]|nr:hypothetical protein [Actinomycetota bacterium]MDQ3162322.1 hypothetical protein [Actinomycetota bacterium]
MRAAQITKLGSPPELADVDQPRFGEGEALVEVLAAGLNPVDISIGSGKFYGGSPDTPYTPGSEAVGRVLEGASLGAGTRVYFRGAATFAERTVIDEAGAIPLPDSVSEEIGAACGIAGLTGWLAASWRAPVRPDDTVLVLGATGVVGSVAAQAAKLLGAKRVFAAGRNEEALERLRTSAMVEPVALSDDLPEATLILDALWGKPLEAAMKAAPRGVRVVQIGQSAGPEATLESNWVRGKLAEIYGFSLFFVPPDVFRQGYLELVGHAAAGRIAIEIEPYPLDRIGDAWERQQQSPNAKIVITNG